MTLLFFIAPKQKTYKYCVAVFLEEAGASIYSLLIGNQWQPKWGCYRSRLGEPEFYCSFMQECVCGINYKSRSNLEIAASQDAHPRMGESVGHYLFQAAQLRSVLTACITLEKDGADESTQFQGFLKVFGLCTSWFVRSIPAQKNISSPYRTSSKMECFIAKDAALQQVIFFDKNGKAQRQ